MCTSQAVKCAQHPGWPNPLARRHGLTLIELMLAMLIGTFLLLGTLTVFTQSRMNLRVSDSMARLQDNARYTLNTMEPDIRLAKFWGRNAEPGTISPIPANIVVTCDTIDTSDVRSPPESYTAWALNFSRDLWAVDETSGYAHIALGIPCAPKGMAQLQSDTLIVRHASNQITAPTPEIIQVHSNLARAEVFNSGVPPAGYGSAAQTHNVMVNIYYVNQSSNLNTGIPSLRIKTLTAGGVHQDQELISGVENMQVQLGVDTDGDGEVERYVDADHDIVNPTTPGTIPGAQIIAVRLWLLFRADAQENGYTDDSLYRSPDPDVQITPCIPDEGCPYPNNFRRLAVSKTILLRNNR